MRSSKPFKDLEYGNRFFFVDTPQAIFRKTSSRTYVPTYNDFDIRYVLDGEVRVIDVDGALVGVS